MTDRAGMAGAAERRDARLAAAIVQAHGIRPTGVRAIVGQGVTNHVFIVESANCAVVVRFAIDTLWQDDFELEAWCLAKAAEHGIPSPGVLAVGRHDGVPFLMQTYVQGRPGTTARTDDLWHTLGTFARTVHAIPVTPDAPEGLFSRFGRDPAAAWQAHLDYNRDQLGPADPLIGLGVYTMAELGSLRDLITRLGAAELSFGLSHGDLSMTNVLVTADAEPVLIDWGAAAVGPVPYHDLLTLTRQHQSRNDPSASELEAFATGCRIEIGDLGRTLADLDLLGRVDLVRWAIDRRPDRLAAAVIAARYGVRDALR
ncbi:hypothetical protein GCM10009841_06400 [Microlunatus panaciterrae]|uniref:Aminoglycoside phosphotransferase (APT) family kinase protein n=1 Tax=Microlunatus panaciterrae TaxID=400768 RepID=A0ABS2RKL1_9ACTN|nr:aminoglycoside phosphotransferase family protein [Microlunatus panaciterrae]MBM7798706.1 aminoglycoside phosphotransferase (APT) family kinase protein [Microlunatus panaciterrae]